MLSGATDELQAERDREPALKKDYLSKLGQAVNLGELRKQKLQVQEYVTQLEKQLPGKAEMDALLSDINQAGLGRGLQFDELVNHVQMCEGFIKQQNLGFLRQGAGDDYALFFSSA